MSTFNRLPFEIVTVIAEHLDANDYEHCVAVNKLFHAAVTPLQQRQFRHQYIAGRGSLGTFKKLLAHSPQGMSQHVRLLAMSFPWTDILFLKVLKRLPHLNELIILAGDMMTDGAFQHIGRLCPHLIKLELHNSPITQTAMEKFGRDCYRLKHLELGRCTRLDWNLLTALASCPLEDINIHGCYLMDNNNNKNKNSNSFFLSNLLEALASQRGLQQIRITEHKTMPFNPYPIPFDPVTVWPRLTYLNLQGYFTLDENWVTTQVGISSTC